MRLGFIDWFLLAVAVACFALSGCFVQRIDRECVVLVNGQTECRCRDKDTGRFALCAPTAPKAECWESDGRPCR